jgi:hypothetical protein
MSEELKSCPFCGSSAQIVQSWTYTNPTKAIQCSGNKFEKANRTGCPACNPEQDEQGGFGFEGYNEEELIKVWNARPIEDQLRAENEKLKEALAEISCRSVGTVCKIACDALKEVTK